MCGIDVFGPLPLTSKHNQYVIVCTDYMSKWVITRAVPAQTAVAVADFLVKELILKFGAPECLVSDQGTPFLSAVTQELLLLCQTRHYNTSAYNPQCNGLTEAFNKVLAVMLSFYRNDRQRDWDLSLQYITHAYNTSRHASTGFSPFVLLFGRECRAPLDVQLGALPVEQCANYKEYTKQLLARLFEAGQIARDNIDKTQAGYQIDNNVKRSFREFRIGDLVLLYTPVTAVGLSPKLVCHFFGPYRVIDRKSRLNYVIESVRTKARGKNVYTVHVKRVKRFTEPLTEADMDRDADGMWHVPVADLDPELRDDLADPNPTRAGGSETPTAEDGSIVRQLRNRVVRNHV